MHMIKYTVYYSLAELFAWNANYNLKLFNQYSFGEVVQKINIKQVFAFN